VAYVIDTPTRHLNSSIIHTQPMSADAGDSDVVDTPADVGWKSGCPDMQIRPEIIELVSRKYVQSAADVPTFYLDGLETFKRMEMGCVGGCEPSIEMFEVV
jgi:hypothetical protein